MRKLFIRKIDNSVHADAYKAKLILALDQYRPLLILKYGLDEANRHADIIISYIDFQHEFHRTNVMDEKLVSKISTEFIHQLVSHEKSTDDIFEHGNTVSEFFEFIMSIAKVKRPS
jgi:hypothetical protein